MIRLRSKYERTDVFHDFEHQLLAALLLQPGHPYDVQLP
jgi:hypothetical protein